MVARQGGGLAAERTMDGASAKSAHAGAAAKVDGEERGTNVSAVAGFRLPWPQDS